MSEHTARSFENFKAFTLAVVRGERAVYPNKPKVWLERMEGDNTEIFFKSMEDGSTLLSERGSMPYPELMDPRNTPPHLSRRLHDMTTFYYYKLNSTT